jgi:hypothetical protein
VAKKKFPVGHVARATLGKGFAECLMPFAESLRPSAKPGFPVVNMRSWSLPRMDRMKMMFFEFYRTNFPRA